MLFSRPEKKHPPSCPSVPILSCHTSSTGWLEVVTLMCVAVARHCPLSWLSIVLPIILRTYLIILPITVSCIRPITPPSMRSVTLPIVLFYIWPIILAIILSVILPIALPIILPSVLPIILPITVPVFLFLSGVLRFRETWLNHGSLPEYPAFYPRFAFHNFAAQSRNVAYCYCSRPSYRGMSACLLAYSSAVFAVRISL